MYVEVIGEELLDYLNKDHSGIKVYQREGG